MYPLTIGTIFQSTRFRLQIIFAMIWLLTCSKKSLNTREIMEVLHLKSYRITWQWVQKIRVELNFFPETGHTDEVETDSFTFRVKSKTPGEQQPVPANLQASAASAQSLSLGWENNSGQELANGSDLLMVGLYDQESGEGYTITGGFTRQQETALITLPANWKNRTVEVFVFMVSTLGIGSLNSTEHVSSTVYGGSVVLTD